MASSDPHTVKAFDNDLEQIRAMVAEIGGLTEAALQGALTALIQGDELTAARIVSDDRRIDDMAENIERHCLRLIALRAPMADDLRLVLAAFKISVLIERMGDCARSIAEQVPKIHGFDRQPTLRILEAMLAAVSEMVRLALDAFVRQDAAACELVCASDDTVDALHDRLFGALLDVMADSSGAIPSSTCLLLASLKLERIGDHAVNVAKVVYHSVTGERLGGDGVRLRALGGQA